MMLLRYLLDLIIYYFAKCKYIRKNFYSNLLSKNIYKLNIGIANSKDAVSNSNSLDNWIDNLSRFDQIIILASGPSLSELSLLSENTLYFTTNSSVCKVLDYNFVYFTFTREYINTYIKFGFKNTGWKGTFFLFTKSKKKHKIRMETYQRINKYLSSSRNREKEILLSDLTNYGQEYENYIKLNDFCKNNFGFEYQNLNSGISLLILGIYVAEKMDVPIEIYGLDAGIGGKIYAFNKIDIPGNNIEDDRSIKSLQRIYTYLIKNKMEYKNHSFFPG